VKPVKPPPRPEPKGPFAKLADKAKAVKRGK